MIITGTHPQSRCWPGFFPFGKGIGKSVIAEKKKIIGHNLAYAGESEWQQQQTTVSSSLVCRWSTSFFCCTTFLDLILILKGCRPTLKNLSDSFSNFDMNRDYYDKKKKKKERKQTKKLYYFWYKDAVIQPRLTLDPTSECSLYARIIDWMYYSFFRYRKLYHLTM